MTVENEVRILDATSLQSVAEIPIADKQEKNLDLRFSGDGKLLALINGWYKVEVFETLGWKKIGEWHSGKNMIHSTQLSPDGKLLASPGEQFRIWNLLDGRLIREWKAHRQPTDRVAFSPDGQLLATASQDGSAKIWSVGDWRELAELRGHLLGVHCLAFSPNSQRLATGSADLEAIKLWDLRTYREAFNISLPMNYISSVGFSLDGSTLSAVGEENQSPRNYFWSVPSLKEIDEREKPL